MQNEVLFDPFDLLRMRASLFKKLDTISRDFTIVYKPENKSLLLISFEANKVVLTLFDNGEIETDPEIKESPLFDLFSEEVKNSIEKHSKTL